MYLVLRVNKNRSVVVSVKFADFYKNTSIIRLPFSTYILSIDIFLKFLTINYVKYFALGSSRICGRYILIVLLEFCGVF